MYKGKLDKSLEKRKNLILKSYPYILSFNYFENFLEYGESSRQKGFIPPKFKRGFIEDLLESGKCICGADLSEDEEHREALLKLLEDTNPLTDKSEEVTSAIAHVREVILKDVKSFKKRFTEIRKDIKDYEKEVDTRIEERKIIRNFLDNYSEEYIKKLNIKTASADTPIKSLSGGNQQKVILARWLLMHPEYLILDEPTRGIDVGTKVDIQKLVLELASEGMSVTFISSETDEMLRTCSRLIVLRDRKIVGELTEDDLSQNKIMKTIAGGESENE